MISGAAADSSKPMPILAVVDGSLCRSRRKCQSATTSGVKIMIKLGLMDWNSSVLMTLRCVKLANRGPFGSALV